METFTELIRSFSQTAISREQTRNRRWVHLGNIGEIRNGGLFGRSNSERFFVFGEQRSSFQIFDGQFATIQIFKKISGNAHRNHSLAPDRHGTIESSPNQFAAGEAKR